MSRNLSGLVTLHWETNAWAETAGRCKRGCWAVLTHYGNTNQVGGGGVICGQTGAVHRP